MFTDARAIPNECLTFLSCRGRPLGRDVLDDLACLQAGGTNHPTFRNTIVQSPDALQIRHPPTLGRIMGVRNVVARHRLLTANFTNLGHYLQISIYKSL